MSRRKKKPRPPASKQPPPEPREDLETTIRQRASIYRCPNSLADDFRGGCEMLRQDVAIEIDFIRVALETWSGRTDPRVPELTAALTELLEEHRRHDAALARLRDRFDAIAFEEASPHEHLDPVPIQHLLRTWVFYDPPQD